MRQISATFRLEIGQWDGLSRIIYIFQPNSIVSFYEIAFFKNFRFGARFFFCSKIQFRLNWCNFSIGNGSTDRTLLEVHRFSAKFHRFGLWNGIFFSKFLFRWSFFIFAPEFSLRQIISTFRLEINQWEGVPWRIIIFLAKFYRFGLRNGIV